MFGFVSLASGNRPKKDNKEVINIKKHIYLLYCFFCVILILAIVK
jgi:hypothetical protein